MEEEQCENSIHDYEKQIQNQQEHIKCILFILFLSRFTKYGCFPN